MTVAARDVRWAAGGTVIVDGVTLSARPGRLLGLVGPNGSGKSSLLRLICGLRRVKSGVVSLDERELTTIGRRELAQRMALVEQQVDTEKQLRVRDIVALGRIPHQAFFASETADDVRAIAVALDRVGMTEKRDRLWHTLSGGERQRVQIARALAQCPSELLLDEPTNHLDIRHQLDLLLLVKALGITSIVALHDLNLAVMFCDEIAVLSEGRLVACGPPEDVLTPATVERVFGVAVRMEKSGKRLQLRYLVDSASD